MHIDLPLHVRRPINLLDSFDMYGERSRSGRYGDAWDYENYNKFKAECKICHEFTPVFRDSGEAKHYHFLHCSRAHGFVFPEDYNGGEFKVSDAKLQKLIILCIEYELPLPAYDFHDNCVKQMLNNKVVCVIHEGNEYGSAKWMDE